MNAKWQQYNLFQPTEEHKMLRQMVASFVKEEVEEQALRMDREERFNLELFKKLGTLGLLGITVSPEFGGGGMDALSSVIAHEELSCSDPGFCLAYLAHSILCTHNISMNASLEQKKRFLPKLCSGEWVGAMAMSEAEAGTDVLGMKTHFERKQNSFILNGRKMWITNGAIDSNGTLADCVLVYAKSKNNEISTFVVERGFKGYELGQVIKDKTGMRASNTSELVFNQCEVPFENLIRGEEKSLSQMMRNLEIERLTLSAMSLGIAKRCLEEMNRYASERKAFQQPIRNFGQIQKYLSESYSEYMACRTYVYDVARRIQLDESGQRLYSDAVKLISAQMGKRVADRAIQVMGGYGYVGEYRVERLWRDAKLLEIGGGTNEALEKNIAREMENQSLMKNN